MIHTPKRERILEIAFAAIFSIITLRLFFILTSSKGFTLGNDPAVYLLRINEFLNVGKIQLGDIWAPPLYHILLATFMAFTGASSATNVEQTLFLMNSVTALIDWLMVFSVYLIGAKFFDKKTGVLSSALMLVFFPLYEINLWGGYTSLLSLSFMFLLFLYLSLAKRDVFHNLMVFMLAFFLVLSHQLTAFLMFIILLPFVLVMFFRSKGHHPKVWIVAILGGLLAFLLYYSQTILPHLGDILTVHVFSEVRSMLYQAPLTAPQTFITNFGFTLFFAFAGIFLAFFRCKEAKKLGFYFLLSLSFFIPLLLSQSYLFGLYLPYHRFIYYLLPPMAIFAAVCFSLIVNIVIASYCNDKGRLKGLLLKIVSFLVIVSIFILLFFHLQGVFGKIGESTEYYAYADVNGYDAGLWLRNSFPDLANVVVTEKPGSWFGVFSNKSVIVEYDPASGRNSVAETVLDLAYEIEHPLTLIRAYESRGAISDENYISINGSWRRVSQLSEEAVFLSFLENGVFYRFDLFGLSREVVLEEQSYPKKLMIKYSNDKFTLSENILVQNNSYPITVMWTLSPLKSEIDNATLYITNDFDLYFSFESAYVPGSLNWENPWSKPSYVHAQGNESWAVVDFSRDNLTENYIGVHDQKNEVVFALKFIDTPDWGNVGALFSKQINAVRFQYQLDKVNINQTASFTYQILTSPTNSFPEMQLPSEFKSLFDFQPASEFGVQSRNYATYVKDLKIEFLVYDKERFTYDLLHSRLLELVYSNDRYVICRTKGKSIV